MTERLAVYGAAQYLITDEARDAYLAAAVSSGNAERIELAKSDVALSRSFPPRWWRKAGEPLIPKLGRG